MHCLVANVAYQHACTANSGSTAHRHAYPANGDTYSYARTANRYA